MYVVPPNFELHHCAILSSTMPPPAVKKRKLSPLSRDNSNKIYTQDTVDGLSQDSADEETENVLGHGHIPSRHTPVEAKRNASTSWSSGTYDSNMFKLKANELLAKVRPDYERRLVNVENSLRKLKVVIERIPDREAKSVCKIIYAHTWSSNA